MRIPRDLNGMDMAKLLSHYGYSLTKQTGSHMRLTTIENGQHHITIPAHNPLKIGTLNGILVDVASHFQISKEEIMQVLF